MKASRHAGVWDSVGILPQSLTAGYLRGYLRLEAAISLHHAKKTHPTPFPRVGIRTLGGEKKRARFVDEEEK
jgi:hypothetical protein